LTTQALKEAEAEAKRAATIAKKAEARKVCIKNGALAAVGFDPLAYTTSSCLRQLFSEVVDL